MDVAIDLKHVSETARALVFAANKERARYIRSDLFIPHAFVKPILNEVQALITDPSGRAKGIAVIGRPNSGKSSLVREIGKRWGVPDATRSTDIPCQPILGVTLTDAYKTADVYSRIFKAIKAPNCTGSRGNDGSENAVVDLLQIVQCKLLQIDEFSDILKCNPMEQRRVMGAVKFVMNEAHVGVIALGTSEMEGAFNYDTHLSERFARYKLPRWTVNRNLQIMLKALQQNLPLRKPSSLLSVGSMRALVDLSNGILGNVVRLVQDAAIQAIIDQSEYADEKLIRQVAKVRPNYELVT